MLLKTLRRINLNTLYHFRTLYNELSITKAAEKLEITQPAMSKILSQLRDHFKDTLFIRGVNGEYIATEKSKWIAKVVFPILDKIDLIVWQEIPFDPSISKRKITIGVSDKYCLFNIKKQVNNIMKQAPNIEIEIKEVNRKDQEAMNKNKIECILTTQKIKNKKYSIKTNMYSEKLFGLVQKVNLEEKNKIDLQWLEKRDHIYISEEPISEIKKIYKTALKKAKIQIIQPSYDIIEKILKENSNSIIIIGETFVQFLKEKEKYQLVDLPFETERVTTSLYLTEKAIGDPAWDWVIKTLKKKL